MRSNDLIYKLLTKNTGIAICDSGGENGRAWQQNQKLSQADFEKQPSASLEVYKYGDGSYEFIPTVSLYHKLSEALELDDLCNEFNALDCGNWNGEFYGTDQGQCDWLIEHGFTAEGEGFNTYNWDNSLSQIIQGQFLKDNSGENYALIQVHGGADARGGYTDAYLFKISCYEPYSIFDSQCFFDIEGVSVDYRDGDGFTDSEGQMLDKDQLNAIGKLTTKTIYSGYAGECY